MHLSWEGRSTIRRRRDGFLDAFRANGLPLDTAHVHLADGYLPDMGARAIDAWLDQHGGMGGITAIFCAADNLALGVMTALDRAGVRMRRPSRRSVYRSSIWGRRPCTCWSSASSIRRSIRQRTGLSWAAG
jgi:DNA-binding LacI/PurR family transcriptional regulator